MSIVGEFFPSKAPFSLVQVMCDFANHFSDDWYTDGLPPTLFHPQTLIAQKIF